MKENITTALLIFLAVVAALVLLTTPARESVETTPPTTEPTAPNATASETSAPETTVPETVPVEDALPRVEDILARSAPGGTAVSHCVYDGTLHGTAGLTGAGKASPAHALARLCGSRRMNPISAFWRLTEEGLYRKTPERKDILAVPAVQPPETAGKEYPCTAEGVRAFLTELLTLSSQFEDGLPLATRLLGEDEAVEPEQVFLAENDCYYAYYVCYSPETAHFLCFYLRGGETITDAEFQLLNLRYADGETEALTQLDQLGDRQAAALMTAAELLLTGKSRAAQGRIPLGYELEGHTVTIERFAIVGSGDTGTLTNYRIRK